MVLWSWKFKRIFSETETVSDFTIEHLIKATRVPLMVIINISEEINSPPFSLNSDTLDNKKYFPFLKIIGLPKPLRLAGTNYVSLSNFYQQSNKWVSRGNAQFANCRSSRNSSWLTRRNAGSEEVCQFAHLHLHFWTKGGTVYNVESRVSRLSFEFSFFNIDKELLYNLFVYIHLISF